LFDFIQDADFTRGYNRPRDDDDSIKLFEKWICKYFKRNRKIEYKRKLKFADINKHLCSMGGPVDHPFTRYAMGYDKKAQNWSSILPFIYPIKEAETETTTILREWKGKQWKEKNWYIADREGKIKFTPGVDKDEFLNKDYFMLIIAPNTFTKKAFYTGQKHLIIAPAHGLAQLAIEDILDNDEFLSEIIEVRQKSEYIQAIIEVPAIMTEHGYAPKGNFIIREKEPLDLSEFKNIPEFRDWI
ncbi:unnamed protein product, partial [marine sediment metagenome]